ncbi:hypothetical protein MTR67_023277 [Solanum verrucosum]|uniref:Uncharacterized protein n=1 Tax=Solanum verrucosum TaxID=315347 RepID=A0AAF0QT73_SOLVR|nr:hypothetical protein MTR67_023277 [Solanum verrucosum]
MSSIHSVFHVSRIRNYISGFFHVLETSTMLIDENLMYEEEPMSIVDRQVRRLQSKEIISVKVLWINQTIEKKATWESENGM